MTKNNNREEIINFLETKFSKKNACKWDFVGYSIKTNKSKIKKIITCLDVNKIIVNKAIKNNVDLIISFHPFKFGKTWSKIYEYDLFKKELIQKLKENKISVYSLHTNFEIKGHNILNVLKKIKNCKINKISNFYASVDFENSFLNLVNQFKTEFGFNTLLSNVQKDIDIKKFAFFPGTGDIYEFIKINKEENFDLIVTSDIKWNEQQLLNSENINFLIIPHNIENVFVDEISSIIKKEFSNLEIIKDKENHFIKGY